MPKMKSRAGVRKRIKLTASGKVKYKKQNTRHILTKKTPKRKRQLRGLDVLDPMEEKRVKDMMAM